MKMNYCMKCGDPIEPGEYYRCDKCGFLFTVVEGSPQKGAEQPNLSNGNRVNPAYRQATVYANSMPGPVQGAQVNQTAQPVNRGPVVQNAAAAQAATQAAVAQAEASRAQSAAGRLAPGQQGAPAVTTTPPVVTTASPQTAQAKTAPSKTQKKKKSKKWLIPIFVILGLLTMAFIVVGVIAILVVGGVVLLLSDDELLVDDSTPSTSYTAASNTVIYDNTAQTQGNDYVDAAIRDPFVNLKGDGTDTVTVMIYMNGSDLETQGGYATADLKEIQSATLSDNVNVVIQTGGTKKWHSSGISNKHSQRFIVKNGTLVLVDDSLSQLDITKSSTLADFITFANTNYPADRNILIFWDHGAGPVYGFGSDENVSDYYAALTLDEIQEALESTGVKFEMIGFDACIMGSLETACALYDYSDYLIASEDFESASGWEYQNWLTLLGYNSSTPMRDVGKVIVDDFILESNGCETEGILALIDLRYTRLLFSTWQNFAYAAEDDLLSCNYNMDMQRSDRAGARLDHPYKTTRNGIWDLLFGTSTLNEYSNCVDLMALAKTMETDEAKALSSALSYALVYCSATSGDSHLTGLSVTLPYDDYEFYTELKDVFTNCGFDSGYVSFLEKFADASGETSYDWSGSDWSGYDGYYDYGGSNDWYYDWSGYGWDDYTSEDYGWDTYDYDDDWYSPWSWRY